ncbi:MAG: hypothetical protein SOU07_02300 [Bacilli bacterium]|nr:hypothetical protein [Acholeplasmataceae bacterium]MDY2902262.1 hypothetical protein [Bacilli bacterium]
MLIIITKESKNIIEDKNIIILEKVCSLKYVKNKNNIILIGDISLNDEGLVEELNYYLDEIFISIDIDLVLTMKYNKKLEEICAFYGIKLINI